MPRVHHVEKCRRSPGNCSLCSKEIVTGEPYYWWQFAFSPKSIRCNLHPPAQKDLTRSAFWSAIYGIQEEDFTSADDADSLESLRDSVVDELNNLKDEIEGNLSNMPDSLQQGSTGELLQERIDALGELISNLESVDCSAAEPDENDDEADKEDQIQTRLDEIRDELTSTLGDISCS